MKAMKISWALVLCGAVALLADPAAAERRQMKVVQPEGGALKRQTERPVDLGKTVRLQGEVRHSRRGYSIGNERLVFDENTSVYPSGNGAIGARGAASLRGKNVTVFGKRTRRGVEVQLVIALGADRVTPVDAGFDKIMAGEVADPSTYRIVSESDETVGEMTDDAPR